MTAGLLSLPSCKKEYFETDRLQDATVNPEWAVPLINSTITVPEVLDRFDDQDVITIDSTGILALRYFSNIFSVSAENLIAIQNQSQNIDFPPLTGAEVLALTSGGSVTIPSSTFDLGLDLSNLSPQPEIHSITFKSGTLDLTLTTDYNFPTTLNLNLPGLTPATPVTLQSNGTNTVSIPLAGKTLDLTNGGPFNNIRVNASGNVSGPGVGVVGDQAHVTVGINSPAYSLILGDIKQRDFGPLAGEVRLRFFENQQDGDVFWADPRVKAIITNGLGADVQIISNQLDFTGPNGTVALTGPLSNILINSDPTVGVSFVDSIDINRSNSNVSVVASTEPTKLLYDVSPRTNPQGGSNLNWIQDTSKVRLDMEVFLPFDGTAVNFAKDDTAEVDIFPLDGDIKEIDRVTIRLVIDNGFPADAKAQVYFHDSTITDNVIGNETGPIDSLFPNARAVVFASPTPDGSGRVDQNNKVRTVLDIVVDREKLNKLEQNGFRAVRSLGWIDTYNLGSQNVQIYSDYEMDLHLGIMVKFKATVGL